MAKKNEIAKVDTTTIQPVEQIESLILSIRGKQVILDRDLARLYCVETRALNQAVQRNIDRFPEDFMFQFTREEAESSRSQFAMLNDDSISSQNARTSRSSEDLKSQIVTSSGEEKWKSQIATTYPQNMSPQIATTSPQRRPASALPYAFTENGIAMLSSVLRSSHR